MNRRSYGTVGRIGVALVFVALIGGFSLVLGAKDHAVAQAPAAADGATSYAKSLSKAFREAAQKVLPSVVMIQHKASIKEQADDEEGDDSMQGPMEDNPFGDMMPPEFRRFMPRIPQMPRPGMPHGEMANVGSGVIIDPSGIILTNNHVVQGGGKIIVRLHDGREIEATDIKTDPKTDLAIVRIKVAGTLPATKLGSSEDAQVGDWVLALGDPFGLEGTVTAGIISAKGRGLGIAARENFIQTDAAINPGNSGGPLVNLDGEIVGINTAISSRSGGNQGVGFAVSSDLAKWVSQQLIATGTVRRAYLGIGLKPLTQELAKQLGAESHQGIVVEQVFANTPAADADVKPSDIIVEYDGKAVANAQELQQAVEKSLVGSKHPLVVLRNGKRVTLQVTAREQPADYGLNRSVMPGKDGSMRDNKLGIEVANLTAELAEKLGIKADKGVVITGVRPGSMAHRSGLATGAVILEVNRKPVKTVEQYNAAMEKASLANGIMLLIRTGQGTQFVILQSAQ
jgi:serine protease Do